MDDATGHIGVSDMTARTMATATSWSAAWTLTTLINCPAVCALTMLAVLAKAAYRVTTADSAGLGWCPSSQSTMMVTS
jgi:hypothetical protein